MDSRGWGLEPFVPSIPTCEPSAIVAGDSATWQRALSDYPADQGWVLHYRLLSNGKTPITIDGSASGPDHLISLTSTQTEAFGAADYNWTAYVTNGSDRRTVGTGLLTIKPDPTTQTQTYDPRSANQQILAQIKVALAAEASNPLTEYRIGDKTFKRDPGLVNRLLEMEAIYQRRVDIEQGAPLLHATPISFQPNWGIPFGGYSGPV